jgi:hypothetical protein
VLLLLDALDVLLDATAVLVDSLVMRLDALRPDSEAVLAVLPSLLERELWWLLVEPLELSVDPLDASDAVAVSEELTDIVWVDSSLLVVAWEGPDPLERWVDSLAPDDACCEDRRDVDACRELPDDSHA